MKTMKLFPEAILTWTDYNNGTSEATNGNYLYRIEFNSFRNSGLALSVYSVNNSANGDNYNLLNRIDGDNYTEDIMLNLKAQAEQIEYNIQQEEIEEITNQMEINTFFEVEEME